MNLVDLVTSQLTGDVLGKLGGLVGTNESQTRAATSAAVPALLSVFSKLASTNSGASQLANSMGGLDLKMLGNLAGLLGGSQASGLGSMGGNLLSSLLGNNLGGIVGTLASFLGMQPGISKTLLTYLAPIVMGVIANQFKGAKPDASGLQRLFSEQQDNIKSALPRGLSLADFDVSSVARGGETSPSRGVHRHEEPASGGFPAWLPLLLPLLGLVGWMLWPKPQANQGDRAAATVPNAQQIEQMRQMSSVPSGMAEMAKASEGITGLFGSLSKVLEGVTDEETAKAAVPQLNELAPVLESLQKSTGALPESGRSAIAKLVADNLGGLQKIIETVMAIPGVKELLGPIVTPMVETISKLGT